MAGDRLHHGLDDVGIVAERLEQQELTGEDIPAQARCRQFDGDRLSVRLSAGREVSVPFTKVDWLQWLAKTTPEQRAHWSIEPDGFAVYTDNSRNGLAVFDGKW